MDYKSVDKAEKAKKLPKSEDITVLLQNPR
jgi:hypothetical protein